MTAPVSRESGPVLHSELAQFCLPAAHRDRNQRLAWVNSICLIYLVIGVMGVKPPAPLIREVAPLEEPVNIPIEQPPVPVTPTQEEAEEQPEQETEVSDTPAIVMVTLDSPSVSFSVPTVGNVLVAQSAAKPPPPRPMQALQKVETKVINIRTTGRGGNYPEPSYPQSALRARLSCTMILLISVDANGQVTGVEVEKSEGYRPLVDHTIEHVRRRFMFPSADGPMVYRLPVVYSPPPG